MPRRGSVPPPHTLDSVAAQSVPAALWVVVTIDRPTQARPSSSLLYEGFLFNTEDAAARARHGLGGAISPPMSLGITTGGKNVISCLFGEVLCDWLALPTVCWTSGGSSGLREALTSSATAARWHRRVTLFGHGWPAEIRILVFQPGLAGSIQSRTCSAADPTASVSRLS